MPNTLADRFLFWRKNARFTQQEVADGLGVTTQTVYRWESGKSGLTRNVAKSMEQTFGVSARWLLTGEGQMMANAAAKSNVSQITPVDLGNIITLPLLSLTASATFLENCPDVVNDWKGETYNLIRMPGINYEKTVVIEITGSSMAPKYPSHCKVLAVEVPPGDYKYAFRVHAISLKSGMFLLKRIVDNTGTVITLKSDNPDYPEIMKVPISDIQCMFKALKIVEAEAE